MWPMPMSVVEFQKFAYLVSNLFMVLRLTLVNYYQKYLKCVDSFRSTPLGRLGGKDFGDFFKEKNGGIEEALGAIILRG